MKPGPFTYHVPAAMMDALAVLAGHEITRALGDGQSLVPMINFRCGAFMSMGVSPSAPSRANERWRFPPTRRRPAPFASRPFAKRDSARPEPSRSARRASAP